MRPLPPPGDAPAEDQRTLHGRARRSPTTSAPGPAGQILMLILLHRPVSYVSILASGEGRIRLGIQSERLSMEYLGALNTLIDILGKVLEAAKGSPIGKRRRLVKTLADVSNHVDEVTRNGEAILRILSQLASLGPVKSDKIPPFGDIFSRSPFKGASIQCTHPEAQTLKVLVNMLSQQCSCLRQISGLLQKSELHNLGIVFDRTDDLRVLINRKFGQVCVLLSRVRIAQAYMEKLFEPWKRREQEYGASMEEDSREQEKHLRQEYGEFMEEPSEPEKRLKHEPSGRPPEPFLYNWGDILEMSPKQAADFLRATNWQIPSDKEWPTRYCSWPAWLEHSYYSHPGRYLLLYSKRELRVGKEVLSGLKEAGNALKSLLTSEFSFDELT